MSSNVITAEIPVTISQKLARIEVLDVLRGFALLGIFLMNIEYFNRPLQEFGQGIPEGTMGLNYAVAWLTEIFVTGKFWVLFSLLFGMGFVVMQTQALLDGRPFKVMYLRRTSALLAFGLLHVLLLWPGDILHSYALVAFALMWLPLMTLETTAWCGALLYLGPPFLMLISSMMPGSVSSEDHHKFLEDLSRNADMAVQAANIYSSGDYVAIMGQRWLDFLALFDYEIYVFISALGVFLMGAGIMRSGRLLNLNANRRFFFRSMLVCGLSAAVLIGLAQQFQSKDLTSPESMANQALTTIGNLPFSFFYLSAIACLMSFAPARKILGLLAPAGKMALSNYLMQSLIASLVFYGYGLGLWAQWGRAELALFVVLVFIGQVIFSNIWLGYFRYGPMEWCWRAITYWSLPTMRVR